MPCCQVNKRLGELITLMSGDENSGEFLLEEDVAAFCKEGKQIDIGSPGASEASSLLSPP